MASSIDYGYGDAAPDTVDYGYGDATPDVVDYGYGDDDDNVKADPDLDYGYGDADDYGYGDAKPDQDMGYGDAKPDQDMGYGASDDGGTGDDDDDDEGAGGPRSASKRRGQVKRRCSVTKYSLVTGGVDGGENAPPAHFDGDRLAMLQHLAGPPPGATKVAAASKPKPKPTRDPVKDKNASASRRSHTKEASLKKRETRKGPNRSISDDGMEEVYDHNKVGGGDPEQHERRKGGLRSKITKMRKRLSVAF